RSMYSPDESGAALEDLARWQLLIDELKDPASLLLDQFARAWFTTLEGDFAAAEAMILDGFARGQEVRDRNAIGGAITSMALMRLYQGRTGELVNAAAACRDVYPTGSMWADCMLAACYAELGMPEEAQELTARLDPTDQQQMPRNAMWMLALGVLARAYYRLADVGGAAVIYELLEPFADFWGLGSSIGTGSLHLPLAWSACVMGENDRAEFHFMAALERNRKNGWTAAIIETELHYGRFLATRDDDGRDHERAAGILQRVETDAAGLGMPTIAREARELLEAMADPSTPAASTRTRFVTRRDRARSRLTRTGRAAIARW